MNHLKKTHQLLGGTLSRLIQPFRGQSLSITAIPSKKTNTRSMTYNYMLSTIHVESSPEKATFNR